MNELKNICRRCSQCCFAPQEPGKPWKKCPYLRIIGNKGWCRNYGTRLGTKIGDKWKCGHRKDSMFNFKNCPYNVPGKIEIELNIKTGEVLSYKEVEDENKN